LFLNKYLPHVSSHHKYSKENCNSLAQIIISNRKEPYNTCPSTHNLPAQLSRSILSIRAKAQPSTQCYNRNSISNKYWVITIRLKSASSFVGFGLCVLSGFGGGGRCLVSSFPCASLSGFGFVLDALELRRSLDGLRGEV
jgi:hypothetical protein